MSCPTEQTLLALRDGRLDGNDLRDASTHLADCAECRALLAAAVGASQPVERIGRFRVTSLAGRGAMGAVYRGVDERLQRPVALKVLSSANFSSESMARLEREARSLARIDHANVVGIYEVGESQNNDVYISMEFVDGGTLADWLETPRSSKEIVAAFIAAGRGLQAAHNAGLVHRDFKPTNVLVTRDGGVKVADFGLADDSERPAIGPNLAAEDIVRTQTGMLLGTPAYMAPEQIRSGAATSLSDQFAFCVALFEALAGHRPFEGGTIAELTRALESGQPLEPRRPLPRGIHRALRRGLATQPSDRYPTMLSLLAALQPTRSRRRLAFAAGVVALLATAAAGTAMTMSDNETVDACTVGEQNWDDFHSESLRAQLRTTITSAWPSQPPAGARPQARDNWQGLGRVRATLMLDTVRRYGDDWRSRYRATCQDSDRATSHEASSRRRCLDNARLRMQAVVRKPSVERFSDSMTEAREQLERCATHLVSALAVPDETVFESVEAARRDLAEASAARQRRELDAAQELAEKAAGLAQEVGYAPLAAEAWLEIGDLARVRGDSELSIEANRKALAAAQTSSYQRIIRRASDNLAWQYYFGKGDAKESARWLDASRLLDGNVPPTDYERVLRLTLEAQLARSAGNLDDAIKTMREAVGLTVEENMSATTIARARHGLITLHMHKLDFDAASVEIEKLASAHDSFSRLVLLEQRASLAGLRGNDREAAEGFESVANLRADQPLRAARHLLSAARARIRLKQFDQASSLLDRAGSLDPSKRNADDIACMRGDVFEAKQKLDEALVARRGCLAALEAGRGALSRNALLSLQALAGLYDRRGETELALASFERALLRWERVDSTAVSASMTRFALARLLIKRGRASDRKRADDLAKTAELELRNSRPEVSKFIAKWRRVRSR